MWDERALYLLCQVTDDHHYQHAVKPDWLTVDDGVLLGINLDPHNATAVGNQSVESDVLYRWHELFFTMYNDKGLREPQAWRLASYDGRFAPIGRLAADQVAYAFTRSGTISYYEVAIPWQALGWERAPTADQSIGVAVAIIDADMLNGERKESALGLFDGVLKVRNPAHYGWGILKR